MPAPHFIAAHLWLGDIESSPESYSTSLCHGEPISAPTSAVKNAREGARAARAGSAARPTRGPCEAPSGARSRLLLHCSFRRPQRLLAGGEGGEKMAGPKAHVGVESRRSSAK